MSSLCPLWSAGLFMVMLCTGCARSKQIRSEPNPNQVKCEGLQQNGDCSGPAIQQTQTSHHLYMLALGPKNAFTADSEREALWQALRGENAAFKPLLGDLDEIPMDYRVEYVFNHTVPNSPRAELHRVRSWMKRLDAREHARLKKAETILLVKGALQRLPSGQEMRLTLAALVFLAETYDGVIFDLLNRQAISAKRLRKRLERAGALPPQIRFIGARVEGRAGLRTVGLPKYGLPDIYLESNTPKRDAKKLGGVVDALVYGKPIPTSVILTPCAATRFDHGCVELTE